MVRLVVGCEGREVALKLYEKIEAELLSGFRSQSRCELAPTILVGAGARIDEWSKPDFINLSLNWCRLEHQEMRILIKNMLRNGLFL